MVNFLAQTRKLVIGIINNPEHIVEEAVLVRTKVVVPGFVPFHSITALSLIPDPPKKKVLSEQSRKFHQIRGEKQQRENRQNIERRDISDNSCIELSRFSVCDVLLHLLHFFSWSVAVFIHCQGR